MTNKTHVDKIGGETKSIGFDFQYYFFLWNPRLNPSRKNEVIVEL
jgi:hypothetical protein